jgi:uncharacterized protein YjbJ (UPF0337 family)
MSWEAIAGNWRAMKGTVREQWGKLTDDDLDRIEGQRDQLLGTLQQRYGKARDVLDREVRDFERRVTGDVVARSDAATTADMGGYAVGEAGSYGVSGRTTGTGVSGSGMATGGVGGTGSERSWEDARMGGRQNAGDEGSGKGTGLEGSVGTSGRTGSEAGGDSAEGRERGQGRGRAEPPADAESESGSRESAGRRSAGGKERGRGTEGGSSFSHGTDEDSRG